MTPQKLQIIQEADQWLAVAKPAGLSTEGLHQGYDTAESLLRGMRPDIRFLALPHRLDRPTSGLLLVAKSKSALRHLNQCLAKGLTSKHYLAITQPADLPKAATLIHYHRKDARHRRAILREKTTAGFREARLWYRRLRSTPDQHHLLQVRLFTGRYHQIRVQLAAVGTPVYNDQHYGAEKHLAEPMIGLHAWRLSFPEPGSLKQVQLQLPIPDNACWPEEWRKKTLQELP